MMEVTVALICLTVVVVALLGLFVLRKNPDFKVAQAMFYGMQDAFQAGRKQAIADAQSATLDKQWGGPTWPNEIEDPEPEEDPAAVIDEEDLGPYDMPDGTQSVVDVTAAPMER